MPPHRPQIVTAGAVLLIVVGATVLVLEFGGLAIAVFFREPAPCMCILSPCCFGVGCLAVWLVRTGTNVLNGSIASLGNVAGIAGGVGSVLAALFAGLLVLRVRQFVRYDRPFDEDAAMEFGAVLFPFFLSGAVAVAGFLLVAGNDRYAEWVRTRPFLEPEPTGDEADADPPEADG